MNKIQSNILEQYRYIVDETNIVSKSNLLGTITFANSKFLKTSGYSLIELLGRPHSILRDPDTPSSFFKDLWDTIQAKEVWHGVITNVRKDGSKYIVKASIYPILSADGNIIEYISIRHDISELSELNRKIELLREYDIEQQYIAREKLESVSLNELNSDECQVHHHPADILSGDSYSIFKKNDGSIFMYIIDGQGHGISPALTVFAISTTIRQMIHNCSNMEKICKNLFPTVKAFLGEIEQLSYIMVMISPDKKRLSYASGGMYPFLIKKGEEVVKIKTNNLPFMEFSDIPVVVNLDISDWESIILFSDGIVEHEYDDLDHLHPENLILNQSIISEVSSLVSDYKFDDDRTLIHLRNSSKI